MGAAESCLQAMMVEEDQDDDDSPEDLLARFSIDYGVKYGQGGFGVTYQALDTATRPPTLCAVKVIDVSQMSLAKIKREVASASMPAASAAHGSRCGWSRSSKGIIVRGWSHSS